MLKKNKLAIYLIVLCMLLTAFGCARTNRNIGTPQTLTPGGITSPEAVTTPPGTVSTPPGTVVTQAPPSQLTKLGSDALKVIVDIGKKKWKTVEKQVTLMRTSFNKLTPKLTSGGVPSTTISNIGTALDSLAQNVRDRKVDPARINANDVTRYVADAMGSYYVTVPTDFLKIDYYLRDIQYNITKKDWARVRQDVGFINSIWQSSRPLINGTDKNIKKTNDAINRIKKSAANKNTKTTLKETKNITNSIGDIKKGFGKKKK